MNEIKTIYIILLSSLVATNLNAQYGSAYHSPDNYKLESMRQQRMQQNDEIHRSQISTPQPSSVGKTSFSYFNPEYKSPKQLEIEAKAEAYRRELQKRDELMQKALKEEREIVKEYKKNYIAYGFESSDAYGIGTILYKYQNDKYYKGKDWYNKVKQIYSMTYSKQEFDKNFPNGSFDELSLNIKGYMKTVNTAIKDVERLYTRFPDKKMECDFLYLNSIKAYAGEDFYGSNSHSIDYEIIKKFFELEKTYPAEAAIISGYCIPKLSPYLYESRVAIYNEKSKSLIYGLMLKQLAAPHNYDLFAKNELVRLTNLSEARIPNFSILAENLFKEYKYFHDNNKDLKKYTTEDWEYIASQNAMNLPTFMDLFRIAMLDAVDKEGGSSQILRLNEKNEFSRFSFNTQKLDFENLIKTWENETDPAKLNAYGLLVATGDTKKNPPEALNYFKKSAEKGNYLAARNYYTFCMNKNSKYYSKEQEDFATELLRNCKPNTSFDSYCRAEFLIPGF